MGRPDRGSCAAAGRARRERLVVDHRAARWARHPNCQRPTGTQGLEESPEQPPIGRFIEQVAKVARDGQVVCRAAQVDRKQVAAQVIELGVEAAGRYDLLGHRQDCWHIHCRNVHVWIPSREGEAPGRSADTKIQNAVTPCDQVVGGPLCHQGKPVTEGNNSLWI